MNGTDEDRPSGEVADDGGDGGHERTVTWRELLAETAGIVGDRQHARWICETAAGADPAELTLQLDHPATMRSVAHLDAMVARARSGEPIQYVLGSWAFRTIDLAVDRRALIPRPETEMVAGIAIDKASAVGPRRTVVDLGTGSGAIGLSLAAELPLTGTSVWMTDVDDAALDLARANVAGIGRHGVNVRVVEGSWFDALPDELQADVVVSNPPYVAEGSPDLDPAVAEWEPEQALLAGPDGLDALRSIATGAPERLRPGGWIVLEHGHDQGAAVRALLAAAGLTDVETHADVAGHDRATVGRRS